MASNFYMKMKNTLTHIICFLFCFTLLITAQGQHQNALAAELTARQQERVLAALKVEKNSETKTKLLLLLIRDTQEREQPEQELRYRTDLHNVLKPGFGNGEILNRLQKVFLKNGPGRQLCN